jgi:hypothetical protein
MLRLSLLQRQRQPNSFGINLEFDFHPSQQRFK